MKNVIAHTFEDELKTANSMHGANISKMSKRQWNQSLFIIII